MKQHSNPKVNISYKLNQINTEPITNISHDGPLINSRICSKSLTFPSTEASTVIQANPIHYTLDRKNTKHTPNDDDIIPFVQVSLFNAAPWKKPCPSKERDRDKHIKSEDIF